MRRSAAQPHPTVVALWCALCTGQPHSRYNSGEGGRVNPPVDSQDRAMPTPIPACATWPCQIFLPLFFFGILQHSGTQCECVFPSYPIRRSCLSLSFTPSLPPFPPCFHVLTNRRTQQRVNLFKLTTCKVYLHASCATPPSTTNSPYLPLSTLPPLG